MILSSFKIVIIFNNTSAEIKAKSADVLLKMITILKELRIAQLCSKTERTLYKNMIGAQISNIVKYFKGSNEENESDVSLKLNPYVS